MVKSLCVPYTSDNLLKIYRYVKYVNIANVVLFTKNTSVFLIILNT